MLLTTPVVKRLCTTRWYAQADATKALVSGYSTIRVALQKLRDDAVQKPECRLESECLANMMDNLETGIMTVIWDAILQRFNIVSKALQHPKLDLNSTISLFNNLINFVALQRYRFCFFEAKGKDLSGTSNYPEDGGKRRKRTRNTQMENYVLHVDIPSSTPENTVVETPA